MFKLLQRNISPHTQSMSLSHNYKGSVLKTILILLVITLTSSSCTNINYEEHTAAADKYVLGNGLTILTKQNSDTKMVAIDLIIKQSIAEDKIPGISSLTSKMLLLGTNKRSREQIIQEIESAGGTITAKMYNEY